MFTRRLTWILVWGLLGLACGPPGKPMNVIVIVLDTVRADAIGAYGIPWSPSPTLDALASGGVQWRTCIAQSPWTAPSVGTMLTGEYPSTHGATAFGRPPASELPTLASRFQAAGYRTFGAVSTWIIGGGSGFGAGFDSFQIVSGDSAQRVTSRAVTDFAIQKLQAADGPFFGFMHFYDAHFRYEQHRMISRLTPYGGTLARLPGLWAIRDHAGEISPADRRHLRELYQGEVTFIDRELRRLVRCLEELGVRENTLLVITADHGEEFFEHGWLGHTVNLHDNLLHVPLIFNHPGRLARGVRGDVATHLDLLPTILDLADLPALAGPGRELFGTGSREIRSVFSEVEFLPEEVDESATEVTRRRVERTRAKTTVQRSIRRGDWKAIENRLSGEWSLYDLASDPHEMADLAAVEDSVLAELREELLDWAENLPQATHAGGTVSPEEIESLRALGYVN